ncbi:hypothetical protein [Streptomyces sp. NPDC006739]|uniref:hypothetical protein n=1 Tax=Streptomyces sp. NPDC006739 TaxID=3364763 RepID=UPI0036C2E3AE
MNDRITGGMVLMTTLASATGLVRWAVSPASAGRHRAPKSVDVTLDDLLGPPTAYTTGFEHADNPIKTGFAYCAPCGRTTAGSLNKDGWLCGECLTPAAVGGAA